MTLGHGSVRMSPAPAWQATTHQGGVQSQLMGKAAFANGGASVDDALAGDVSYIAEGGCVGVGGDNDRWSKEYEKRASGSQMAKPAGAPSS